MPENTEALLIAKVEQLSADVKTLLERIPSHQRKWITPTELAGLYATERCEAFWATAPLAQHDTAKQDDLVLNADHCLDACRYLLMATADQRFSGSAGQTNFKVW